MRSKSQPDVETKKKAISLRLAGATLIEAGKETGLSAPTVAALVRAYEDGGWEAIESRRCGRPKSGSRLAAEGSKALRSAFLGERLPGKRFGPVFSAPDLAAWISKQTAERTDERAAMRRLADWDLLPPDSPLCAGTLPSSENWVLFWARGPRGEAFVMPSALPLTDEAYCALFQALENHFPKGFAINLEFAGLRYTPKLAEWLSSHAHFQLKNNAGSLGPMSKDGNTRTQLRVPEPASKSKKEDASSRLTHLQRLEAEAIHIMREVVAEAENPVMLYSIGKDSAVMLHLAVKAFYPARIPFPLLHVDTTWKFQDMYRFRSQMQKKHDFKLLIYTNEDGLKQGINPFTHGSQIHTDIMKTVALRQALDHYGFDVAFGGARRDEEKSRAKERIFSFRTKGHCWDPKNQRPELWSLYNAKKHKGESIRVFPISNWTELDIWQYIYLENIPIVPLYFSSPRPVVNRDGTLIMVDDDRMPLAPGEVPMMKSVRFRTLGCYPLTGAVESTASSLEDIIQEMLLTKTSERQGRVIDHDSAASMEKKKQEGYF